MPLLVKAAAMLGISFLAFHWLIGGQAEIIEEPPESPDISVFHPSETP